MVKTLVIQHTTPDRERDSKLISEYLRSRGWMSSITISKALADPKRKDTRKVTNLMDRLRDYVLESGFLVPALAIEHEGLIKYWYPVSRINEYLARLGAKPISIESSKYGIFTEEWFEKFMSRPRKVVTTEFISDAVKNQRIKNKIGSILG